MQKKKGGGSFFHILGIFFWSQLHILIIILKYIFLFNFNGWLLTYNEGKAANKAAYMETIHF